MCLGAEYTHRDRQINTAPQIDPQIYITGIHWTKTTPANKKPGNAISPSTEFTITMNPSLQKKFFFFCYAWGCIVGIPILNQYLYGYIDKYLLVQVPVGKYFL